jgi:hypothetical protein
VLQDFRKLFGEFQSNPHQTRVIQGRDSLEVWVKVWWFLFKIPSCFISYLTGSAAFLEDISGPLTENTRIRLSCVGFVEVRLDQVRLGYVRFGCVLLDLGPVSYTVEDRLSGMSGTLPAPDKRFFPDFRYPNSKIAQWSEKKWQNASRNNKCFKTQTLNAVLWTVYYSTRG